MPRKKISRRRKTRRRNTISRVSRPLSGFPASKIVRLRYVENDLTLQAGATDMSGYTYVANSVYNPQFATGGHQPMGYDQWAAVYNHYTVLSSTISVHFLPKASGNTQPGVIGVILSENSNPLSSFTSVNSLLESKLTGDIKVSSVSQPVGANGTTYPVCKKSFSAKRQFGVNDPQDGAAYGALITSSPAKLSFFTPFIASYNSVATGQYSVIVTIDYTVMFNEPAVLAGS